jgi:Fic family protein
VHKLLTGDLEIGAGLRQKRIGITGTNYRPLDNQFQIKEAMEKLSLFINELKHPLEKALAAVLMVSYIQPFEDGNKRTARTIGNALLLAFNYCPLSYRNVDETDYKKGMLLFYEQNDYKHFKKIFTEQFKMAVEKYF